MTRSSPLKHLPPERAVELYVYAAVLYQLGQLLGRFGDLRQAENPNAKYAETTLSHCVAAAAAVAADEHTGLNYALTQWVAGLRSRSQAIPGTSPGDQLLVDLAGQAGAAKPVDGFDAVFAPLADRASLLYGDHWPEVSFSVDFRATHPRAGGDPYSVTAGVSWNGDQAQVFLHVFVDRFGPRAFAAIPTLLVHELVCHVATQPRGSVHNDSCFAEGFMDYAASVFGPPWIADAFDFGNCACIHGTAAMQVIDDCNPNIGSSRWVGRRAAMYIVDQLQVETGKSATESQMLVAHLALRLNVCSGDILSKDDFVSALELRGKGTALGNDLLSCLLDGTDPEALL